MSTTRRGRGGKWVEGFWFEAEMWPLQDSLGEVQDGVAGEAEEGGEMRHVQGEGVNSPSMVSIAQVLWTSIVLTQRHESH